MPDGLVSALLPLEYYKYLGIYEADSINCPKTKDITQTEYLRRLRKILSSQLHGRHKILAISEFAIPVLRYSATIIEWTKNELQVLDRKTRKTYTMNGGLHPRADVDRMYVHRSMGGHGLLSVEDTVMSERFALYYYLKDHKDALMKKVLSSSVVRTPDTNSIFTPDPFKNHLKITHFLERQADAWPICMQPTW